MKVLSLNGKWLFSKLKNEEWMEANVPGSNYTDLLRLNKIPDPFVELNEKDVYWVAETDWQYKRTFNIDNKMISHKAIYLKCEGIDAFGEIYINDNLVSKVENAFLQYSFEIKKYLREGENEIKVILYSPHKEVVEKQAIFNCPRNCNGMNGVSAVRKTQSHYGWDWGPNLPMSGIYRDIYLVANSGVEIEDLKIDQTHTDGIVTLDIHASINNPQGKYVLSLTHPDGKIQTFEGEATQNINKKIEITEPKLWWTKELSQKDKQDLYTVKLEIIDSEVESTKEKRIGLRTIKLDTSKDEYGRNFAFILNGVQIFVKGANWIPGDSLIDRFDNEKIKYYIDAACFANFNMIRVWGGGYYETDYFYDLCDEKGILIWQDCMFACQAYPLFDEHFKENAIKDIKFNINRIKDHPSLAIISANNEIEAMTINWITRSNYIKAMDDFFYNELKDIVSEIKDIPYIPGSPCGLAPHQGYDKDNVGDSHLWAVWHGLQPITYYRKRFTRFCSEFGFESMPDEKTIKYYAKEKDYDLDSKVFLAHQKCASGNNKMIFYILERFDMPKNFIDYVYLSQIDQMLSIEDASLNWRRNKGRCNGSMYWQFNDCWPVCSWSSIDYFGNYKALHYGARRFFSPENISVEMIEDSLELFICNDLIDNKCYTIKSRVLDFDGNIVKENTIDTLVEGNSVLRVSAFKDNKNINHSENVFEAILLRENVEVSRCTYLFKKEKDLKLPKANIIKEVKVENNIATITLNTDKYARYVRVFSKTLTVPFSDNFFDMFPDEEKIVTINVGNMTSKEVEEDIVINSLTDIEFDTNRLKQKWKRLKILLEPVNFANYVYNRQIPKDIEVKD